MSENFSNEGNNGIDEESIVDGVRRELEEIDATDISEHAPRFDALHKKLQDSLNSIDGL
ncbi:MAG: hypothetical protein KA423_02900 [Candidatus Planktophila sp.]|jgi:hypothetical protein|nr:hypothetical protein [Candidatus Planktophila sp.]MBP7902990.1 hypothetical protein [Candidatus Planktophila sp.]